MPRFVGKITALGSVETLVLAAVYFVEGATCAIGTDPKAPTMQIHEPGADLKVLLEKIFKEPGVTEIEISGKVFI